MSRLGGLIVLGGVLLVAGCVGISQDQGTVDEQGVETTNVSDGDNCQAFRANLTDLLQSRDEDPFGDREWPSEPVVRDCGEQGAFMLLADGLEGSQVLQLSFTFPEATACRESDGVAATGGHHRYYVRVHDRPEETTLEGFGSGSGGFIVDAFAGPVDTRDLEDGQGGTAWGGSDEGGFAAGGHHLQFAAKGWGSWDSSLTEGGAFFLGLVCEDGFSFEGAATASERHLFSHRDMELGAGAQASWVETSAGRALDVSLDQEARLALGSFAISGAGAVQVDAPGSTHRETAHPESSIRILEDTQAGEVTVFSAQAGRAVPVVGAVYADLTPTDIEKIVGSG